MQEALRDPVFWGIFCVLVLFAVGGWLYERRRTRALREVAAALELTFEPQGTLGDEILAHGFELLSRGGSGIVNVMSGDLESASLQVFGYEYTTGSGSSRRTHRQTVALFASEGLDLPAFRLRPEHLGDKIGAAFGAADIDFDSHPKFSARYKLTSEDEAATRARFTDEVLGYFEANPKLNVEGGPGALIVYRARRRASPKEIEAFAGRAIEIAGLFLKRA